MKTFLGKRAGGEPKRPQTAGKEAMKTVRIWLMALCAAMATSAFTGCGCDGDELPKDIQDTTALEEKVSGNQEG